MNEFFSQFETLPQYLSGHLTLSFFALFIGIAISVPLGILAAKKKYLQHYISTFVSIAQTVPSLALLALMVPLLGGTIGWQPALIALIVYSMLPIVTNTITGLQEVDWRVIESGRSVGMTERQLLWNIKLPLALPVIIAGIRTSVIWVVGTATLATPVGADSLGYYIFLGLNTRQTPIILMGCLFSALLAIVFDRMTAKIETSIQKREYRKSKQLLILTFFLVFIGITAPYFQHLNSHVSQKNPYVEMSNEKNPISDLEIVIGAKPFTEQYILANVLSRHLETKGIKTNVKSSLGSKVLFDALSASTIDLYIDYTGTVWSTIMRRKENIPPHEALIKVSSHLLEKYGIATIGAFEFENAYCSAMKKERAKELNVSSLCDLAQVSDKLKIAGDFDFFGRTEGKNLLEKYHLHFARQKNMNSRLMYDAIENDSVDIITAYTTDAQIAKLDLMILDDPLEVFPPYHAILLLSPSASKNSSLVKHLQKLVNRISNDLMRSANQAVDLEGKSVEEAGKTLYESIQN